MNPKPKLQLLSPPFAYKEEFELKDLKEQELVEYIDDRKKKKKVPMFDSSKGVESRLVTYERFLKVCGPLQLTADEKFDKFQVIKTQAKVC